MTEGYIPRSKIKQYGIEDLGLLDDDLDFFITVIRQADGLYLTGAAAQSDDPKMLEIVPANDAVGVRSLLIRLAAPKEGSGDRFTKKGRRKS
jgi:hypothetical protein